MADDEKLPIGFVLDGKQGAQEVAPGEIPETLNAGEKMWVHLDGITEKNRHWLEQSPVKLDPLVIDALLARETRPRFTEFDNGVLIILRGVNLNENAEPEDMIALRMWVDRKRIISVCRRRLRAVEDIRERVATQKGPKSTDEFVVAVSGRLLDRMKPVLTDLDELTDDVEEDVLESPSVKLRERIIDIRKRSIMLRRHIAPQRDVLGQLRLEDFDWLSPQSRRHLQEQYDHVTRIVEDLDAVRERSQIVHDELTNALADRMNKNMYLISVIAAIFLPLGFLTGLLGINVGGIPGAENTHAFFIFCAMLVGIITMQIIIFKKLKWF